MDPVGVEEAVARPREAEVSVADDSDRGDPRSVTGPAGHGCLETVSAINHKRGLLLLGRPECHGSVLGS